MKAKNFPKGSLILQQVKGPCRIPKECKLVAKGAFKVKQNLAKDTYKLEMFDGKPIP